MKRTSYDHSQLIGMDADLETSLKEYGLAWIKTDTETLFYYGIGMDADINEYTRFDFAVLPNDFSIKAEYDWIDDWDDINSYIGMDIDECYLPQQISVLLSYYGYENIFGSSYWEGLSYNAIVAGD